MTGGIQIHIAGVMYVGAYEDVWATALPRINAAHARLVRTLEEVSAAIDNVKRQMGEILMPAITAATTQMRAALRTELIRQEFAQDERGMQ